MDLRTKIIPIAELAAWRRSAREQRRRLVVTNGCFDLLHAGHVLYLEQARKLGDLLLAGLNSDASVRQLKGPDRPINREADRALVLAALESVSAVCIFNEARAASFLAAAQPDVYVKGGDYTVETLDAEERAMVDRAGGAIVILPLTPGRSTTDLLRRVAATI